MKNINVLNEYVKYTESSTKELIRLAVGKNYKENIYNELFDTYKKVRYYNILKGAKTDFLKNVNYHLTSKAKLLKKKYFEVKHIDTLLKIYVEIFYLDGLKNVSLKKFAKTIKEYQINEFNIENETFESNFISLYKEIKKTKENYFKQFITNKFIAKYYLTNHKKVYNAHLKYTFFFPTLYSEAAIDKVYNTGIVSEDKLYVLYYLVASKVLQAVINGSFNYHYILEFSPALLEKDEKFKSIVRIIDNDITKEKISFKITYSDYANNNDKILKYINQGFNFTLVLDDVYKNTGTEAKNLSILFKYIVVDINKDYYSSFNSYSNIIKTK